jgi:aspartate racemase
MNSKVIGIIGGMGPQATADLYLKIIKETKASIDQEHFHVIIDSNPKIPDRTKAILYNEESPFDAIVEMGKKLEVLGVDIGCIPCITSHYYIDEIQKQLAYPLLNAMEETQKYIKCTYPAIKNIGVLATTGTIKARLFEKYFSDINIIYPSDLVQQKNVMEAIYGDNGIKSGNIGEYPYGLLKKTADMLIERGADVILLGCTEIGLSLKSSSISKPLVDPMQIIAKLVVNL